MPIIIGAIIFIDAVFMSILFGGIACFLELHKIIGSDATKYVNNIVLRMIESLGAHQRTY
jgi:hypothetical protein